MNIQLKDFLECGAIIDISKPNSWDGLTVWSANNMQCLASFEYFCESEGRDKTEMVVVSVDDIDGYTSACSGYKAYKKDDNQWFISLLGDEEIIDASCFAEAMNYIVLKATSL